MFGFSLIAIVILVLIVGGILIFTKTNNHKKKTEGKRLFKTAELDKFIEKNKVESLSELIQKAKNGGRK